jgi:hypothetical protein
MTNTNIIETIYRAMDDANEMLFDGTLEKSPETVIIGDDSLLDSMGLVNFVVSLEQHIEDEFGTTVSLVNDDVMSLEPSPFASAGALAEFITAKLA